MGYERHEPSEREYKILERAYRAQQAVGLANTRFLMPPEVPTCLSPELSGDTSFDPVPFGQIEMGAVEIKARDDRSDLDGVWDKVSYGDEQWLVKDGLVLKSVDHKREEG